MTAALKQTLRVTGSLKVCLFIMKRKQHAFKGSAFNSVFQFKILAVIIFSEQKMLSPNDVLDCRHIPTQLWVVLWPKQTAAVRTTA